MGRVRSERRSVQLLVAANLRRLRRERDISQDQLAERAQVSKHTIYQVERPSRYPSEPVLEAVADALGVPITELFAPVLDVPASQLSPALSSFLGQLDEEISGEERRALAAWQPPGRRPSAAAYHLYLLALRACRPVGEVAKPARRTPRN